MMERLQQQLYEMEQVEWHHARPGSQEWRSYLEKVQEIERVEAQDAKTKRTKQLRLRHTGVIIPPPADVLGDELNRPGSADAGRVWRGGHAGANPGQGGSPEDDYYQSDP